MPANTPLRHRHHRRAASAIEALIGSGRATEAPEALAHYGCDWSRAATPAPAAVAFPQSTAEIQTLVRWANDSGTALVPSGGRTGLSGGAIAAHGEVVLSLERMSRILDFDSTDRIVHCEAGLRTRALQDYAAERDLQYPIDLAAAGSSHIGGNIATNAGGLHVLRHGMTRNQVAGLCVITGAGERLDLDRALLKDNSGAELRQLFIGTEGTLGVVAEAQLRLTSPPPPAATALIALTEVAVLGEAVGALQHHLTLLACEFLDAAAMARALAAANECSAPPSAPGYLLVEYAADDAAVAAWETLSEAPWMPSCQIASSKRQCQRLWRLRESLSPALAPLHPHKWDLSVRPARQASLLAGAERLLQEHFPNGEWLWFGHAADGNLHLNVLPDVAEGAAPSPFAERCQHFEAALFGLLLELNGSASAEHGIGLLRQGWLLRSRSAAELAVLRDLKRLFDPNGVLNPGKLLPATDTEG